MATQLQLKRKITTARNISKTTKAMQMIAASRLKNAQDSAVNARPYAEKIISMIQDITPRVEKGSRPKYMQESKAGKHLLIVIGPDKGLVGGMIANLVREALLVGHDSSLLFLTIGKRAEKPAKLLKNEIIASFPGGNTLPRFSSIYPIVKIIDEYYLSKEVTRVSLIYTKFQSVFTQKPVTLQLLPIHIEEKNYINNNITELIEPNIDILMPNLLKHYIEIVLYQSMLESFASEQAARMNSMQNATNNAKEIIEDFTLQYNKLRQEKITAELLDITGGSVASM